MGTFWGMMEVFNVLILVVCMSYTFVKTCYTKQLKWCILLPVNYTSEKGEGD